MKQFVAFFIVAALGAISTIAHAGLFDDDEARRSIKLLAEKVEVQNQDNDAKFLRLEESIKNLGIIQLLNQIELLNAEIARLRGQTEVLANQNEQLQKRQRDFYVDIDTRLRAMEGSTAPTSSVPPAVSFGAPTSVAPSASAAAASAVGATAPKVQAGSAISGINAPNAPLVLVPSNFAAIAAAEAAARERENKSYDVGSNAFRRGDFAAALRAFNTFTTDFPQSQLVSNALYWLGLSQFNLKDLREARATQEALIKKYPDSAKAPDALLVIASVQAEMGDAGSARNSYEDIIAKYPGSDAAAKARTRLSGLRR
ncbi:MAG: tol-pal system protein YbgF [Aeromicrobium sp.]|nr:tol-pal system protein YbgF [Burkholderiales bacterium]